MGNDIFISQQINNKVSFIINCKSIGMHLLLALPTTKARILCLDSL
jgi:hypothetical protein